jgi:hypothetical protein
MPLNGRQTSQPLSVIGRKAPILFGSLGRQCVVSFADKVDIGRDAMDNMQTTRARITTRVDSETLAEIERLAKARHTNVAQVAS